MSSDEDIIHKSANGSEVTDKFWSPSPSASDVSSTDTESDAERGTPVPPPELKPFQSPPPCTCGSCTPSPPPELEDHQSPAGGTPSPPPQGRYGLTYTKK